MVRVFANGKGNLGSIPGPVIPKTQKLVLDASLLNTPLSFCRLFLFVFSNKATHESGTQNEVEVTQA